MDKEKLKSKINKELKETSVDEMKKLIIELLEKAPSYSYEYVLCKLKDVKNENLELDHDTLNEYERILADFEKIENGDICVRSYTYETGTYSYYDADVDYVYYPTYELKEVLVDACEMIKKLVLYKEYGKVITLFESIIHTNYTCEEVGNPEYDDSDEVYDVYDVDFNNIKYNLEIDLDEACVYAIYSLIMCNKSDKLEKIWEYKKVFYNVNIKDAQYVGIEKIAHFDKFYEEWTKYLEQKESNKS